MKLLGSAYRAGARLTGVTPPAVRYAAAARLTYATYRLVPGRWEAARRNYAAVLGLPERDPVVAELAREAFENYGRMLADFLLLGDLTSDEVVARVDVYGGERVWEALSAGRGAIAAMPHMGSWDLAASAAAIYGMPLTAVTETMPGSLEEAVVGSRSAHGMRVVPLGHETVREIYRTLDANGLVALLCDLPHGPGTEVSFFGLRATVPGGPASIAIRRQCPILPVRAHHLGAGRYAAYVDPPILPPAERGKGREQALMQELVHRFEGYILKHPEDWYAFWPLFSGEREDASDA